MQNRLTKRCLEIALGEDGYYHLIVGQCSGQTWKIEHLMKAADGLLEKESVRAQRRNGV